MVNFPEFIWPHLIAVFHNLWMLRTANILRLSPPCSYAGLGGDYRWASQVDGTTLDIRGERIRFQGVDAPQIRQSRTDAAGDTHWCDKIAADALNTFRAKSRPTRSHVNKLD